MNGRRIDRGATFAVSPLYHLSAYTIRNPMVIWALQHGAYEDWRDRPPHVDDCYDEHAADIARRLHIRLDTRPQLRG